MSSATREPRPKSVARQWQAANLKRQECRRNAIRMHEFQRLAANHALSVENSSVAEAYEQIGSNCQLEAMPTTLEHVRFVDVIAR